MKRMRLVCKHRINCGDSTSADVVGKLLGDVQPHLMVTDPPYGVEYDPSWRAKAGVNKNTQKMGKVLNDDRADWREAWALFPGDVAYVWHASLFTREILDSLEACGFKHRSMIIWAKDRLCSPEHRIARGPELGEKAKRPGFLECRPPPPVFVFSRLTGLPGERSVALSIAAHMACLGRLRSPGIVGSACRHAVSPGHRRALGGKSHAHLNHRVHYEFEHREG
jgi:hypothetical protein